MKYFLFLISIVIIFTKVSQAQWQEDVRLTNNSATSWTTYNNGWCVASSGDTLHVALEDTRDGHSETYYKRSTDGGSIWGADTRLTNNIAGSKAACVAVSGLVVHIVWYDNRDGNYEIYYKRSTDGGTTWEADTRLTNNSSSSYYPSVSANGLFVNVVWYDYRDGNSEIYFKRSTDGGLSWGADTRLTSDASTSQFPCSFSFGSLVHVVWFDGRDGNLEIYYKRSTDEGLSWGADIRLTNNTSTSYNPCLAVFGSLVHVVWYDNRDGNDEIYYKRSTDGGISWGSDTRLTTNIASSLMPSITVSGQSVHVVWRDDRDGNYEIYYKNSTDAGISWSTDTRLTNNIGGSIAPSVSVSGSVLHVVWHDNRDGNEEIYYKRNPTGNLVRIGNINSESPNGFSLSQNYPNPFNPSTKIKFEIPKSSFVTLSIYDVLGREVTILVNENLSTGRYSVELNASNMSSGMYFYKLSATGGAGSFVESKKMLLIK